MKTLILSGGGARGAFEVGVLKKLVERGEEWDLIAGVSVGALNGGFLAQYEKGQQLAGVHDLEQFWLNIKSNKDVYRNWFFRQLSSLWRGGLYNTAPLKKLVYDNINPDRYNESGVSLIVGAVSYETGDYYSRSTQRDGTENIRDWILASASFPVAFPTVPIDGQHWTDGGVRNITPLFDVLSYPVTGGHIVMASPYSRLLYPKAKGWRSAINVALRCGEIMSSEIGYEDIDLDGFGTWQLIAPQENIIKDPLTFDPVQIREAIAYGYESAT